MKLKKLVVLDEMAAGVAFSMLHPSSSGFAMKAVMHFSLVFVYPLGALKPLSNPAWSSSGQRSISSKAVRAKEHEK